jgi:hypothetical protein
LRGERLTLGRAPRTCVSGAPTSGQMEVADPPIPDLAERLLARRGHLQYLALFGVRSMAVVLHAGPLKTQADGADIGQ